MVSFAISGDATEGDEVVVTITFDKPIDRAVTFTPVVTGGSADDHDFTMEAVVMQPYTTVAELKLVTISDYEVESTENVEFDIEVQGIAERYLVHPDVVYPSYDVSIANYFDPNKLVINFAWGTSHDFDILTWSDTPTYPGGVLWGTGGATGANPEIDHSIWLDDPAGDYYVTILDWWEGIDWDYTFTIGHPDGTIQTINGTFDGTNYPYTSYTGPSSWGSPSCYKVLKVVVNGTSFVVTEL
jgi:hypothetical protein